MVNTKIGTDKDHFKTNKSKETAVYTAASLEHDMDIFNLSFPEYNVHSASCG